MIDNLFLEGKIKIFVLFVAEFVSEINNKRHFHRWAYQSFNWYYRSPLQMAPTDLSPPWEHVCACTFVCWMRVHLCVNVYVCVLVSVCVCKCMWLLLYVCGTAWVCGGVRSRACVSDSECDCMRMCVRMFVYPLSCVLYLCSSDDCSVNLDKPVLRRFE